MGWPTVILRKKNNRLQNTVQFVKFVKSQNLFKNVPTPTILPVRTHNKMLTVVISWGW